MTRATRGASSEALLQIIPLHTHSPSLRCETRKMSEHEAFRGSSMEKGIPAGGGRSVVPLWASFVSAAALRRGRRVDVRPCTCKLPPFGPDLSGVPAAAAAALSSLRGRPFFFASRRHGAAACVFWPRALGGRRRGSVCRGIPCPGVFIALTPRRARRREGEPCGIDRRWPRAALNKERTGGKGGLARVTHRGPGLLVPPQKRSRRSRPPVNWLHSVYFNGGGCDRAPRRATATSGLSTTCSLGVDLIEHR